MESTNSHVKHLETIHSKILKLAKFVFCHLYYHIIDLSQQEQNSSTASSEQ